MFFDEDDAADFTAMIEETGQVFLRADESTFKATVEEKPAEIGKVFGSDYAGNYSVFGRTAMLYLKPDTTLIANDVIVNERTRMRWLVHDTAEAAYPMPLMLFALVSISPM